MHIELTVTAKGQVTLRKSVLAHLGVKPGEKISVSLMSGGRLALVSAVAAHDIRQLRGALRRKGRRPVTLKEMQKAIEMHGP
jgi:bifunctional DNA-binding transcriptional regulator/antitoxin component of YhaV-PrlF toxin-antitoxin module